MAMRMDTLRVCVLALLALCGCALARPTEEGAQANSAAAPDDLLETCAHPAQNDVTAQQVQGAWYALEVMYTPLATCRAKNSRVPPCILTNFTSEGTRLSLYVRTGDTEITWTLDPAASGMWEETERNATVHLSTTADGQLLLACLVKRGIVRSFVLSRIPHMDETAVMAARSSHFSSTQAMRPDLQSCDALRAAATVASNPPSGLVHT